MYAHFFRLVCSLLICAVSAPAQNSILWEITGNGISAPSYLMGTLKFIGEKEFYIPDEAHAMMKKCTMFAIEDQIDHRAQHELNKALHFPKGQSLKTVLSADQYRKVEALFEKEFGITAARFAKEYARLIPLALSITMTRLSLGEKVKYYDMELVREAKKYKLKTYSLEPIEREAEALRKYPMQDQVTALMHSVDHFSAQKEEFRKLVEDYPKGDLEEIFQYTLHPTDNNPVFVEEFYSKRNAEWLPRIEKMMHDKPSFIAIGVSHLEGEKGLLALLRERGYTLTPLEIGR